MPGHKIYFNWSTGKDSALALHELLQNKEYSVEYLLTSVNAHYKRVSMHGLRVELLQEQIRSIGIPGGSLELSEQPTNQEYEAAMFQKVSELKADGFKYAGFGDIFLEDLKKYREEKLAALDIKPLFPLWKRDTRQLIHEFISTGFKAITVCVNAAVLDRSYVGRMVDEEFVNSLPKNIDPCGENGEFHTFCFDGPLFKFPIGFKIGEIVYRDYNTAESKNGFWFCDLLPDFGFPTFKVK
ncbi:MAG: diphthine--ammonia ligase [Cyclobacteriaceae bacterium]|nr:diphthine--ammonia ligase [Cyclobacteriaceae bacterium]